MPPSNLPESDRDYRQLVVKLLDDLTTKVDDNSKVTQDLQIDLTRVKGHVERAEEHSARISKIEEKMSQHDNRLQAIEANWKWITLLASVFAGGVAFVASNFKSWFLNN